jgi:hypothetical protein
MGSGPRFSISTTKGLGLAVYFDRFPHEVSINLLIGFFTVYIGFGKGYDNV